MKYLLLTPIFKTFNKVAFIASLKQNTFPVLDTKEIEKQEQKEAIRRLYP